MKNAKKAILILLTVWFITPGLFSQTIGITGDSTISQCETKTYTISILNNSGNPLTNLVITALLENFTGFSYVSGTSSIDVNGGGAFCTANATISGDYSGTCLPAPSAPYLTWDIDAQCPGSPFTLNNGDTLNITFDLATDCDAVSGSLNTYINYQMSGTPFCDNTGAHTIQVLPGGVTIKKTPNVIPQELGQDVTWTLTIENSGFGIIENVVVTDVLGAGLAYVSSLPAGVNAGQTTTWTSAEFPTLDSMDPGDIEYMTITATVIACDNLDNTADVRFGCNPSPTNTCFDTSVDGGTARASVQRIVRTPVLAFTPSDINFTYCSDTENISFIITNVGDGIAYDVYTIVDFGSLAVSNVSAGAIYNNVDKRFELAVPLAASGDPGDSYNLSFDLTYNTWCGGFPSGSLLWQELYKDECDQEFYPPVELSTINAPAASSSLSVSKNGAGAVIQIGDPVTYTVTSSYSGPINCGSGPGTTGLITVVDTVPNGFTVTDAGGGVWVPGGGGTGGTITWTYTPLASLNTAVTFQSPLVAQCETYCNTTFTNSITASGTDCCGCALNASDSETTAIECAEGVTSDKTSSSPTERCDDTTYTNTYNFSGGSGVVLSNLQFEEHAELQQEYNGNLTIMLGAANVTGCVAVTDNTPGGSLLLDFSGCAATPLAGQTLTITYDLTATANTVAACGSSSFYSWSSLDLEPAGSNCLGDGIIHETTIVNVVSPSMSLSIAGLGQIVHQCESQTITMTLTQTSANTNPKDVKLVLSGLNYYVVNPAATICGGIAPVSCTPVIDGSGDYVWEFGDAFTGSGQSATLQLQVQKRCTGTGDLVATAYFDDLCTDDATADELCSVVGTASPALLLSGDLLIEKTPETYYAVTNHVQWEIYVTNRGNGTAYNVWVDDVLGSGLLYEHGVNPVVVDNMTGVTINDSLDHNSGAINGASVEINSMAAGERRQITFIARQVNCNILTNDVIASWGCVGVECQAVVTDSATVEIPQPLLINTNVVFTPVDACASPVQGIITLRNAGQTTCYNLHITETLPAGLNYIPGSTSWSLNGGTVNGPPATYDPVVSGSPEQLDWSSTEIAGLAVANPGDTIEIWYDLQAECPFTGGNVTVSTSYENPCSQPFNTANSVFTVAFREPDITITKTRTIPLEPDAINCGQQVTWEITVTNTGDVTDPIPVIWLEDTLDPGFTFVSATGGAFMIDNGFNGYGGDPQLTTFEIRNLPRGASSIITLVADSVTSGQPNCNDLTNTVTGFWGCGAADGSSATKPGVDEGPLTCLTVTGEQTNSVGTRVPPLDQDLSHSLEPSSIPACGAGVPTTFTLTITNNSNTSSVDNLDAVVNLPAGLEYDLGSSTVTCPGPSTNTTDPGGGTGPTLTYYALGDTGNNLCDSLGPGESVTIVFALISDCYLEDDITVDLYYYDCCDTAQLSTQFTNTVSAEEPDIVVTKTPDTTQVDCGANVTWTITVTNNGTGNAGVVRVEDTPGAWIDVRTGQPGDPIDMGGGVYGWEINNLARSGDPGDTAVFTLVGTLNPDAPQADCTAALRQNNVEVFWGCGSNADSTDNDPTTTGYDCTDPTSVTAGPAALEMPDLHITDIIAVIDCTVAGDGNFSGTVEVTVENQGDGDTLSGFTISVTDGTWTGTGTTGVLAAGASRTVLIDTPGWSPVNCNSCNPYTLDATVDSVPDVCECDETNNTYSENYTAPIADLVVNSITPTCTADGQSQVVVNIGNTGCANITSSFTVHLEDDQGNSDDITVNSLNAGSNTDVTFTNWPTACAPATINFTATADYNDDICECDALHSANLAYNNPSPDLVVSTITPSTSCTADGTVSGTIQVQVTNNGNGAAAADFRISVNDGQGWSSELWYNTDLGGTLPLAASESDTVTFNWTRGFTSTPYVCNFPAISVTVDSQDDICECTNASNTNTTGYNMTYPNLRVLSVTPSCTGDGTYSVEVVVDNNGCGNAAGVTVQLSDNDGQSQVIALNAGASQTLTFAPWPADGNPASLTFTAVIDPGTTICELSGTDNSDNTTYDRPNLNLVSITPSCTADDNFQVSLVIQNNGSSAVNNNFVVRLTDNDGNTLDQNFTAIGGTLPLNDGTQQTVTFSNWPFDCNPTTVNFTGVLDPTNLVCESNSGDNTNTGALTIYDLQAVSVTADAVCTADGTITGTMEVAVANSGGNAINSDFSIQVSDGQGWTSELLYNADLGGTLPLGASANDTVTFNWTRAFTSTPYVCSFPAIGVTVDSQGDICECTNANNTNATSYNMTHPNLRVLSVTPTFNCVADGSLTGNVAVTVDNNGCGDAPAVPVQLTSTGSYTFTNQTVTLTQGSSTVLNFTFTPTAANCDVDFTAAIDPSTNVCELSGSDNAVTYSNFTPDIPDLIVQSDTLQVSCSSDDNVTISGNLVVANNGCGSFTTNIPVTFILYPGTGCTGTQVTTWSQTLTGVAINGSATQSFAISRNFNLDMVANSTNCQFSIGVELDDTLTICEFDGNNTYCTPDKNVDIPDLQVQNDTLGVTCSTDGNVMISGNVTIANDGCGSNMTTDVPVRFTLFDGNNCTGTQLDQWEETFSSMNIPAGGGTQIVAITPQSVATNLVTNSTGCEVSIRIEVDHTNSICESNSANNTTYCSQNIPVDIPDLEYQSDTLTLTATDDGQAEVSGSITVVNNGCGSAMTTDIPVQITLYDNINCTGNMLSQWEDTLSSANIAAGGGTQTFTITPEALTGNYCTSSTNCQVSMRIELDHTASICESDGTDNSACVDKTVDIPELTINSVASTIICLNDGNLAGTTVNVSNTGCSDATNVVVRLVSDCGLTFADQTVDLAVGETTDVFFPFTAGITDCTCNFTGTIDPDNSIFECDGTNNTLTSTQGMLIPDLEIQSEALVINCADDGVIQVSGTVTLVNNGCGPNFTGNIPMRFTLFDNTGSSGNMVDQWTQTFTGVNLPSAGGTQTFTIQLHDITANFCTNSTNCMVSILMEADYNGTICEWDGTDNTYSTDKTSDCLDLEAATVTANTNCADDGNLNGTISVTVRNSGGNPITSDFYVRLDDGEGWSSELRYNADLGGTLPLAAGASSTVTFEWNRTFETDTCEYPNITAQVDSQNEICQCTTENDTTTTSYQIPLPNLKPTSITPICSADGSYLVEVTIENNGCSDAGSFTVHLEDNLGNTMDILVNSLAKGASTTVGFNAWPATCDPTSVTFTVVVDSNTDVCEITGTDNTMEQVYTNTSPDLVITEVKPVATCRSPGDINGSFEITLQNNGNGAAGEDFKVIINDGEGWSTEQFYQADLMGSLPLAAGETVTLRINWNRDFTKEPFKCNFNNIVVSLDVQTSVCECAAGNNEMIVTYRLPYPDLVIQSLLPICSEDGQRQLQLTIGNNGCEEQKEDFTVTFSDNRDGTRTASFTSMGGTLPLKKGSPQTVTLTQWGFDCTTSSIDYTAAIVHEGGGCDLLDTNNTLTVTHSIEEPDLLFGDIQWTCNADGSITFTVTVSNNGFGDVTDVPIHIYDGKGTLVYNQTMDLPKGTQNQFTFTTGGFPQDQNLTFRFVVDENDKSCECDGSNNEKSISFVCQSTGLEPQLKISKSCPPGQQPGGLFRFEIQVENTGETDLTNARIEDFLPEGFQYVSGSSALNGQALSDPQISDRLTWTIGTLKAGEAMTLVFSAVADADIDPGRYCNETRAVATFYGDAITFTSDKVQCCTVVVRQAGAACCLKVEEWAMEPGKIPDGPLSFIEPYFHTESAMYTIYSIFNLWKDRELEKGTMPLFMKERLQNYARSTIEEFYLDSQLGLTQPDGTLWLSYAGAYPERRNSWVRKQVDETMTTSQIGFELLALDKTVKIEERQEVKQKLKDIIEKKLTFLAYFIDDLPHAWEIKAKKKEEVEVLVKVEEAIEKYVKKQDEKATLYDKAALYLAVVELKKSGYSKANIENLEKKLRDMLKNIDNRNFDRNNLREEFLFTLALLEAGQTGQARAKIKEFENIYLGTAKTREDTTRELLDSLHDHALAAAVDYKANGTAYEKIMQQTKEKFYLKDTGVFAEKQPDFTFILKLHSLAPMILAFDTNEPEKQESYATVLYRTFDEVGLFLKKRNLSMGKPLYSLLKNYPFTEPLLPVLNFTKANQDIAPVFSKDAVIHSTQLKPIGEILIPQSFSKILSPSYETSTSRIAAVSFGLQYFGRTLMEKDPWVIKEEGRSFNETGKTYVDSLLKSGAGIQFNEKTLLPFDHVAVKGPKQGEHNLEPLNAGTGAQISIETLSNYLLAEKLYVQGSGKYADTVQQIMGFQDHIVKQFKEIGYIPEKFNIFIENDTGKITVIPSNEKASKITTAKLFHALPKDDNHKFLESAFKKTHGKLIPEDLIFLSAVPDLVPYFEKEIQTLVDYKDSNVSYNAADIIGRRLLGDNPAKIQKSLENLKKHWDKEAVLPKSDLVENIERGLIYHHEPQQLLLYLLATHEAIDFRFERTLNFFTYLLENEWGIEWNSFITLPSVEYLVFREEPKEHVEPGDLLTFRVRVDNTCPEGFGTAHDLPSLYLKAAFTPSLIYTGTQRVDGLDVLGDFQWHYSGLLEGSVLEYIYQALVPNDFSTNFIDGWIYAGGRQGFEEFGPETAVGDECEDIDQVGRLNIIPFEEIQGLVYEDSNVNGIKDVGERGIPNILIKNTRGRLFRSDGEGRFTLLAGDEHEGVQIELKSIPSNYLMIERPTKLVNRHYTGEIYFGFIPCKTVTGFVYLDENQNDAYDEGEFKPEGVLLKSKGKEVITGKDGNFIFRNLPVLWQQWIEIKNDQPYYKDSIKSLMIHQDKEDL